MLNSDDEFCVLKQLTTMSLFIYDDRRKGTSVCAEGLTTDPTADEDLQQELHEAKSVMSYSSCELFKLNSIIIISPNC